MKRNADDNSDDHGDEKQYKGVHLQTGVTGTASKNSRTGECHDSSHSSSSAPSTFAVRPTSKFSGNFPFFRRPHELGHFSLDIDGSFRNDNSHLKRYYPPARETSLSLDLREGFETFRKRDENVKSRLNNVMTWILSNRDLFQRTRKNVQLFLPPWLYNADTSNHDSIQSLDADFVAWRGHFTKFLCTPYEHHDGWEMAVTLFRGTVYISEVETEQDRARRLGMSQWEQLCTYGGYKFEQYVTSDDGQKPPDTRQPVNNIEAYCSVIRSDLGNYKLLYSGEVDCCRPRSSDLRLPEDYVELKTSRKWYTQRNENSFYRYKLMKWWAQSFLVGIPEVICGFRDDDGVVSELKHFRTMEMHKQCKGSWDATVCFNFLHQLLAFIKSVVVIDDPSMVYLFEYKPSINVVSYTEHRGAEHRFIPEWYASAFVDSDGSPSTDAKSASVL